ncbi:MAG: DUF4861 family protein, partial [Bacteroidota bacterium]|nr:DUF4861 family protein [Bacteroidota bacterium]
AISAPEVEDPVIGFNYDQDHALIITAVRSGEPFRYRFGSCWSKGDIKTAEEWFALDVLEKRELYSNSPRMTRK